MKKIFTILILSTVFAGELEVDGNLTVTGDIDSPTIDALRDDTNYEYKLIMVYLSTQTTYLSAGGWMETSDMVNNNNYHPITSFDSHITNLFNDGWELDLISGTYVSWWIFKRALDE